MLPAATPDQIFDALGSPQRREIMRLLARQPQAVGDLARALPISRPAVSKHLALMQSAGLIAHDRQGTRHLYRLEPQGFEAARDWLDGFWDDALTRFKLLAENTPDPARKYGEPDG